MSLLNAAPRNDPRQLSAESPFTTELRARESGKEGKHGLIGECHHDKAPDDDPRLRRLAITKVLRHSWHLTFFNRRYWMMLATNEASGT